MHFWVCMGLMAVGMDCRPCFINMVKAIDLTGIELSLLTILAASFMHMYVAAHNRPNVC